MLRMRQKSATSLFVEGVGGLNLEYFLAVENYYGLFAKSDLKVEIGV